MPQKQKNQKQQHKKNLKNATRVAVNSLFMLVGLTVLKIAGGYLTNIVTFFGDAMGSFSDIISISAIIIGLKLSQKKASNKFKYGFHRFETMISLLISIFIVFAGYRILRESIDRFFIEEETGHHLIGIIASLISIAVSLFAFHYQRRIGKQINSTAFLASAYDKRNDAIVSFGVLGSIVANFLEIKYVEGSVGILISLVIMWTGFKYGKEALLYLLDYWDNPEITEQIRSILRRSRIVTAVKKIRLRHVGTYIFGEAFLTVNPFTNSKDLRDEIHRLDRKVEDSVEHLGDLVLYIDPPKPTVIHVAIPVITENGLKSQIAEDPKCPFKFLMIEIRNNKIRNLYIKQDQFMINKVSEIAQFLANQKTNILISSMIGPLLYYNLRLKNIKVYPHFLDVKDVENTMKLLMLDL